MLPAQIVKPLLSFLWPEERADDSTDLPIRSQARK